MGSRSVSLYLLLMLLSFILSSYTYAANGDGSLSVTNGFYYAQNLASNTNQSMDCKGFLFASGQYNKNSYALFMTNGHCLEDIAPNMCIRNLKLSTSQQISIQLRIGGLGVSVTEIVYAAKTNRDIAILKLSNTYSELEGFGITPYMLSNQSYVPEFSEVSINHEKYVVSYNQLNDLVKSSILCAHSEYGHNYFDVIVLNNASNLKAGRRAGSSGSVALDKSNHVIGFYYSSVVNSNPSIADQYKVGSLLRMNSCFDSNMNVMPSAHLCPLYNCQ